MFLIAVRSWSYRYRFCESQMYQGSNVSLQVLPEHDGFEQARTDGWLGSRGLKGGIVLEIACSLREMKSCVTSQKPPFARCHKIGDRGRFPHLHIIDSGSWDHGKQIRMRQCALCYCCCFDRSEDVSRCQSISTNERGR